MDLNPQGREYLQDTTNQGGADDNSGGNRTKGKSINQDKAHGEILQNKTGVTRLETQNHNALKLKSCTLDIIIWYLVCVSYLSAMQKPISCDA